MAKIRLEIKGESAKANVTEGILTHGAVGVVIDVIVSGAQWEGIPYKVVCVCNGVALEALVIDGVATVPHECLIGGYKLQIGIDGSNAPGTVRIPTVLASCGTVAKSTANVQPGNPTPPTPDIYAQIMAAIEAGKIRGQDGISPTVGVMIIDGGHRITITDKAGMRAFDVLDGHDGDDYVLTDADKQQIADMARYDDSDIKQGLSQCLKEPDGMAVGKYFRIAAIDENGHALLEAVDAPGGGVTDVQVAGASVVQDGVANVPIPGFRTVNQYTLLRVGNRSGLRCADDYGTLTIMQNASDVKQISGRYSLSNNNEVGAIMPYNFDQAVKHAMCDAGTATGDTFGKPLIWTAEEQAAAQQRIGILSVEEVLFG